MWSLFFWVRKVGLPMSLPWPDDAMGRAEPHGHGVAAVQVSVFLSSQQPQFELFAAASSSSSSSTVYEV